MPMPCRKEIDQAREASLRAPSPLGYHPLHRHDEEIEHGDHQRDPHPCPRHTMSPRRPKTTRSSSMAPAVAHKLAERLQGAQLQHRKAKDLLRASGLPVLDPTNVHVAKDLAKVKKGTPLSPVLLVRGELAAGANLTVGWIPPDLRQPSSSTKTPIFPAGWSQPQMT